MIKIGLAGGRGFVGQEFLKLVEEISEYSVEFVGSNSLSGESVKKHTGWDTELRFQDLSKSSINSCAVDVWIIAQPNGHAAKFVEDLEDSNVRLVDVSSDHRFEDDWSYGLAESNRDEIRKASRIANPGCYATASQLALLPLANWLNTTPVLFGVSGFSGAGKTPSPRNDPIRLKDNLLPYSISGHTHELEISRHLGVDVRFVPHVANFFRGLSVTACVELNQEVDCDWLSNRFTEFYKCFPLVSVTDDIPEIRNVAESNRAVVGGFSVDPRNQRRVGLVSVIDNLRKGAASQIVQNLNLMFDFTDHHGLLS